MAVTVEYWSAVYTVGLEGLNDDDHLELNAYAAEGWEPVLMTSVHGGFGTLILFRRETPIARPAVPGRATTAKKSAPAKKKATAVKKAASRRRQ